MTRSSADSSLDDAHRFVSDPRGDVVVEARPWGEFCRLSHNRRVTVKSITIEPGHRLSLQRHSSRGELWQILDAPLHVTVEQRSWLAQSGELVWVPPRAVHRLTNKGGSRARVLEISFGDFDEEDIERLEDDYAR